MKNFNKYCLGILAISFATLANADNVNLKNEAQSNGAQPYRLMFHVEHCLDINCKNVKAIVSENMANNEPTRQIYPSDILPEDGVVALRVREVYAYQNPYAFSPAFTDFQTSCMVRVTEGNTNLNLKILTIYDESSNVITDGSCSTPPLK